MNRCFFILLCYLTGRLERALRIDPTLCPEGVLFKHVPLNPPASLDPLRTRLLCRVRGLSGATRRSDFPLPFVIGVRLATSRFGLLTPRPQTKGGSPSSQTSCVRTCGGPLTAQGSAASRQSDASDVTFCLQ